MFLIETLSTPRRGASSYRMERRLWLDNGIQRAKMNEDVPLHFSHVKKKANYKAQLGDTVSSWNLVGSLGERSFKVREVKALRRPVVKVQKAQGSGKSTAGRFLHQK